MSDLNSTSHPLFTEGHALIVGVGEYQESRLNAANIVADAQGVATALLDSKVGAYLPGRVSLLTGPQATRTALIGALKELAERTSPESTVFLFLCSHGELGDDGHYYLITTDTKLLPGGTVRCGTGLSASELVDLLRKIPAHRLLCIINTCYSGYVGEELEGALNAQHPPVGAPLPAFIEPLILNSGQGRALITSSQSSEQSYYPQQGRYTRFGQALIDGLYGKGVPDRNGYIGLYELYQYLYAATAAFGRQKPVLSVVKGVGSFPIALHPHRSGGLVKGTIDREPPANTAVKLLGRSLAQGPDADRARVLKHVRETWIEGVLNKGLYAIGPLRPMLVDSPDGLPRPADMTLERYKRPPQPLPPDQHILSIFDMCGGQLLIRGEPGAGKTTLLLELARDLITYVEDQPLMPIPVVFLLSWWADQQLPFAEWLVKALSENYPISRPQAEEWVRQDRLILLLDGLDDVPAPARDTCVAQLNQFLADHGSVRLVVCCQTNAYEALTERPRLRGGSLVIMPLDTTQVDDYLSDERLRGVRAAIDRSGELRQLARLPLMLNLMRIAYANQAEIVSPENDTADAWSRQLFDTYVNHQFEQTHVAERYTREQTVRWLAWLARCMASQQQVDFYVDRLEQFQTAADSAALRQDLRSFNAISMQQGWLPTQKMRRIYRGVAGLSLGLALSPVVLCIWSDRLGLVGMVLVVLAMVIFFGVFAALFSPSTAPLTTVRTPTLSEALGPKLQRGVGFGLALIIGLGIFVGWRINDLLLGAGIGFTFALILAAFYFLALRLARLLAGRWTAQPIGTIRRLLVFVVCLYIGGIISGLAIGLVAGFGLGWLLGSPLIGTLSGLLLGLFIGALFGTIQGLEAGGQSFINHYMLRWLLARSGYAPWDYPDFLHYAASLTLLYRIGEGYMFIHRQMMDYFAQTRAD